MIFLPWTRIAVCQKRSQGRVWPRQWSQCVLKIDIAEGIVVVYRKLTPSDLKNSDLGCFKLRPSIQQAVSKLRHQNVFSKRRIFLRIVYTISLRYFILPCYITHGGSYVLKNQTELALRDCVKNIFAFHLVLQNTLSRVSELGLYLRLAEGASSPAKYKRVLIFKVWVFEWQPRMWIFQAWGLNFQERHSCVASDSINESRHPLLLSERALQLYCFQ